MKERPLYMVQGETGEYEDQSTWVVECWSDKDLAYRRVNEMNDILRKNGVHIENGRCGSSGRAKRDQMRIELNDPGLDIDTTGAEYYMTETVLRG